VFIKPLLVPYVLSIEPNIVLSATGGGDIRFTTPPTASDPKVKLAGL